MTHDYQAHTHAPGDRHSHHDHDRDHHHEQHEQYSARSHPEFVVLEIGDDLGALIVHTEADLHGTEIEISPADDDSARSHKDVLERRAGGHPAYTAVFDAVPAGAYTLWSDGVARAREVEIAGGIVAELDWTGGPPPARPPAARPPADRAATAARLRATA